MLDTCRYEHDSPQLVKDLKVLAQETGEKFSRLRTWLYNKRTRDKARQSGRTRAPDGNNKSRIPPEVVAELEALYEVNSPNLMQHIKELAERSNEHFVRLRTWLYVRRAAQRHRLPHPSGTHLT